MDLHPSPAGYSSGELYACLEVGYLRRRSVHVAERSDSVCCFITPEWLSGVLYLVPCRNAATTNVFELELHVLHVKEALEELAATIAKLRKIQSEHILTTEQSRLRAG